MSVGCLYNVSHSLCVSVCTLSTLGFQMIERQYGNSANTSELFHIAPKWNGTKWKQAHYIRTTTITDLYEHELIERIHLSHIFRPYYQYCLVGDYNVVAKRVRVLIRHRHSYQFFSVCFSFYWLDVVSLTHNCEIISTTSVYGNRFVYEMDWWWIEGLPGFFGYCCPRAGTVCCGLSSKETNNIAQWLMQ